MRNLFTNLIKINKVIVSILLLSSVIVVSNAQTVNTQLYLSDPTQALDRIDPFASNDLTTASTIVLGVTDGAITSPPVVVNTVSNSSGNPGSTTFTVTNVAVGSGLNRGMVVGISQRNRTITSVTYGGAALDFIGESLNGNNARVSMYGMINPPTGTANVVVTLNQNPDKGIVVGVTNFTGVNQTVPLQVFASNTGNSKTASVAAPSAVNELVYNVAAYRANMNASAGQTVLYNISSGIRGGASTKPGASPTVTTGWTSGSNSQWAIGAVSIKPAPAVTATFSLAPTLCSALTLKAGTITITNYVTINSGAMPPSPAITAQLKYGGTNIITLTNPTYSGGLLTWTGNLPSDITIAAGNAIDLSVTTAQAGVSFTINYDSKTKPSKVEFRTTTYTDFTSYAVYDAPYPGGSIITQAVPGATVYPRAVVTDPFGFADITGMNITITPPGTTVTATSVATAGCTRTYQYTWVTPNTGGTYTIPATVKKGLEGTVTKVQALSFLLCNPITTPVFALGATSSRCQGAGTVSYTATSTNSTGMSYVLDASSITGGNSINASTGAVTFVSGWSGTSVITATAAGCSGPKSSTHTVTVNPTVGTPVFTAGATSARCKAAGTVTYTATAANNTSITYTLDATSLSGGNTINASTGLVSYVAGWYGNSIITASAAGCGGPKTATHTATSTAVIAVNDVASGTQGNPVEVNVLTHDLCDIDPTSVEIVLNPTSGSLQVGANGLITYLPNGDFFGTDSYTYKVCSNGLPRACAQAVVTITLSESVNDPCAEATRSKIYYLPFPENTTYLRKALISAANTNSLTNNVRNIVNVKVPYPGTVITYDHWEDGYEADITIPIKTTTLVWGDGNLNNGIAPGYANDIIPAGGSLYFESQFAYNPRVSSTIIFDGKDKLFSTNDIAISKVTGDAGAISGIPIFSVQNIKTNVVDITRFGKFFIIPFGENITLGGTSAFKYTGMFVKVATNGTVIKLDYNGDGVVDITTAPMNEGDVYFYDGTASTPGVAGDVNQANDIKAGATVTANYPVGVDLIFGGIDYYGTRNLALLPSEFYGSTYYSPVHSTNAAAPVYAFFTNTLNAAITINWNAGNGTSGSFVIPAKGTNYLNLNVATGYKFKSAGNESYTGVVVIDADASGSAYDWSFNLIPDRRLTSFASIAWAPGSSDGSGNYNPVWVTAPTATTLYIKYDGQLTSSTATMSPCDIPYDIAVPLAALQSYKIFDTDNDQSGLAVYTCDGTKIAAVWGQDPSASTPQGSPAQDVGYVMEPRCLQQVIVANDDLEFTDPNTPIIIGVLSNDFGFLCTPNPSSLSTSGLLQPANGTIVLNANGTITYTPNPGFQGTDQFEYRLCSIEYTAECDIALVTVKVTNCFANALENIINGQVFVELLPDDGAYNSEVGAAGVRVNLYNDVNCNGIVDGADAIAQSTISNLSGNYHFSTRNGYNAKDDFDPTAGFGGNDGGLNWNGPWTENGDDNNFTTGDVRIMPDPSSGGMGNAIRIGGPSNGISRPLTFNGATGATLSFAYRRQNFNDGGEQLLVQVNGTTRYTIDDGDLVGTDINYTFVNIPLDAGWYNANSTNTIQFITNGIPATNEFYWIDIVDLTYFKSTACYIVKVDPSNTGGNYTASSLNTQTASFSSLGTCEKSNYLGVLANMVASDDTKNTTTNVPVVINVLENDVIGKPNASVTTAGMANQPANGSVVVNPNGTITYTPNPGFNGTDDFEYQVCSVEDPQVCDIALVTVTVSCISIPNQNTITGIIYNDANSNSTLSIGEAGISGIVVNLYRDINGNGALNVGEPLESTLTTTSLGTYQFNVVPPTTTSTYLDQFNANTTANQSNGSTSWVTSWTKVGEASAFNADVIRITSANGLTIRGNANSTRYGAYRTANLSTAIAATLSFNFNESGLDLDVYDYVDVQIATTASPTSWTLLKRYTGADGNQTGVGSFDITPYISSTTTIRFVSSGFAGMTTTNIVYFDNVQISYNVPTAAKYIVQLAQPLPMGYALISPTPPPTGIHTASFTLSGEGACAKNFGLTQVIAENDINQTPVNTPVAGQLLTNDKGLISVSAATIGGSPFVLGTAKQVSGKDKNGIVVANAGMLTINSNGTYLFTPTTGFTGTIDNVTYTGLGGAADQANLSIEVIPPVYPGNNPPTAQNDTHTTEINTTINSNVLLNDSDPDGNTLNVSGATIEGVPIVLNTPTHVPGLDENGNLVNNAGSLSIKSDGTYTFIPSLGFTGTIYNITYTITDNNGGTDTAILSLSIINNLGNNTFAHDDANSAKRGATMSGNIVSNDFDPEGNAQTVTSSSAVYGGATTPITIGTATVIPSVGTLTLASTGAYTFVPLPAFVGTVPVKYNKCDNGTPQACDEATLYLTSLPLVIAAVDDINQAPLGKTVNGNLLTNDDNLSSVTQISFGGGTPVSVPIGGSATLNLTEGVIVVNSNGTYTFTPAPGYIGAVPPINYTGKNVNGDTDTANLYINVVNIYTSTTNNPPIANHDVATVQQGKSVTVKPLINDSDPDGDLLTVSSISYNGTAISTVAGSPTTIVVGAVTVGTAYKDASGYLVFTAAATYVGDVPFDYIISDGNGKTATSSINVTITDIGTPAIVALDDAKVAPKGVSMSGSVLTNDKTFGTTTVIAGTVTIGGVNTTLVVGTPATIAGVGQLTLASDGTYTFNPLPNFVGTVPVTYTISNGTSSDQATLYLTSLPVTQIQVWVGTNSDDWAVGPNWKSGVVPTDGDDVVFATVGNNSGTAAINDLVVPDGATKVVGNLTNGSDKALVIPAGTGVIVTGEVVGFNNSTKLFIKADGDPSNGLTPNGSFTAPNLADCGATVIMATIQLYAKGTNKHPYSWTDNIPGSPTIDSVFVGKYSWQFFGVPVESVVANPTFYKGFLREYDESKNAPDSYYNKWTPLNNNSLLEAFKGYEVTQDDSTIYNIEGKLMLCDQVITLTRTAVPVIGSGDPNLENERYGLGQNIFGNSFTAAIPISQIDFDNIEYDNDPVSNASGDYVEKTVYLYNTGSFGEWTNGSAAAEITTAGAYRAIPKNTAGAVYTQIPSMQGFLLRHLKEDNVGGGTGLDINMTLPYNKLIKNDKPQTAPKAPLSFLELTLKGKSTIDQLWLFSQEGTSGAFDNGWDGRKYFGRPAAYLYALTEAGNMQVNTTDNLIGSRIAFVSDGSNAYEMTIRKSNLIDYPSLYLVDLLTSVVTELKDEVTTYSFKLSGKTGVPEQRFRIVASADPTTWENNVYLNAYSEANRLYISNWSQSAGRFSLYDMSGRKVMEQQIQALSDKTIPVSFESGAYTIELIAGEHKFTTKCILRRQ